MASALFAASIFVVPMSAMAKETAPTALQHEVRTHHLKQGFPMQGALFQTTMNKRLDKMRRDVAVKERKLGLTAERKAAVDKIADSSIQQVRKGVSRVASDGTVSRDEAKQIHEQLQQARKQIDAELLRGQKPAKTAAKKT